MLWLTSSVVFVNRKRIGAFDGPDDSECPDKFVKFVDKTVKFVDKTVKSVDKNVKFVDKTVKCFD